MLLTLEHYRQTQRARQGAVASKATAPAAVAISRYPNAPVIATKPVFSRYAAKPTGTLVTGVRGWANRRGGSGPAPQTDDGSTIDASQDPRAPIFSRYGDRRITRFTPVVFSRYKQAQRFAIRSSGFLIALQVEPAPQNTTRPNPFVTWTGVSLNADSGTPVIPSFPTQYAGLRVFFHGVVNDLCLVAEADAPGGMGGVIKVRKNGVTYALYLVETSDPNASPVRVQTTLGTKAARLKT